MKLLRNNSWLLCLGLVAACDGGGPSLPTGPTPPGPTTISVTGSDLLLVGKSEIFLAAGNTGVLSAPRWGSDAPAVATVDVGTGSVTAVGTGTATIYVDANGTRGTKLIRTLPDFAGEWAGRYAFIECRTSTHPSYCSQRSTKDTYPLSMTFTQNRDRVSGWFSYGAEDIYGSVSPDGSFLSVAGPYTVFGYLQNIRLGLTQPGELTGTFEEVWHIGPDGQVRFIYELLVQKK